MRNNICSSLVFCSRGWRARRYSERKEAKSRMHPINRQRFNHKLCRLRIGRVVWNWHVLADSLPLPNTSHVTGARKLSGSVFFFFSKKLTIPTRDYPKREVKKPTPVKRRDPSNGQLSSSVFARKCCSFITTFWLCNFVKNEPISWQVEWYSLRMIRST